MLGVPTRTFCDRDTDSTGIVVMPASTPIIAQLLTIAETITAITRSLSLISSITAAMPSSSSSQSSPPIPTLQGRYQSPLRKDSGGEKDGHVVERATSRPPRTSSSFLSTARAQHTRTHTRERCDLPHLLVVFVVFVVLVPGKERCPSPRPHHIERAPFTRKTDMCDILVCWQQGT